MTLVLQREPSANACTFGKLYIDAVYECEILEDEIREVPGQPVASWKVPGKTAIPAGKYRLVLSVSKRFKKLMPEILNVPGFSGIRIHTGNVSGDTEGCLLTGLKRNGASVRLSTAAYERLMARLMDEPNDTWIDVRNPAV